MAGTVADWSTTAASNTSINGIDIGEGCSPAGINNAIREVIAEGKSKFNTIDSAIATITSAGIATITKATRALLFADLTPAANTVAAVLQDPTAAYNDLYVKSGGTGTGSWSATGIFSAAAASYATAAAASAAAASVSADAARYASLPLPSGLTAHYIVPDLGQVLKADSSPVTAAGDALAPGTIVPIGETAASAFALTIGGTYRVDENGVGYVEMVEGVNTGFIAGTFNLTPNTFVSVAMARDTDSTSDGLVLTANSSAQAVKIGFAAGSAQVQSSSVRNGDLPFLNSRYAVAPLQTPTVVDFYLQAGTQSSWVNNSVRDVPDASPLAAGLRKGVNTWTGADSFSGAVLQINKPTKGGLRFYGVVFVQGALTLTDRRAVNEWLMKRCRLAQLKENSYDIFPIIGDSIAMGVGDQLTSTTVPFGQGVQYIDTGALAPLKDPLQGMWPDQYANTGSFAPAFAKTWYSLTGTAACMVGCGNGTGVGLFAGSGSYTGGWLGSNVMPVAARKVRGAIADVRGRLRGVIAYIGTNDRTLGKTQAQLVAGYVALRDSCRTNFGVPDLPLLLMSADTSSVTGDEALFAVVRAAQVAAAYPNNEGIYLVASYQNWLASGHHASPTGNVHLDQFANNANGVLAATGAAAILSPAV